MSRTPPNGTVLRATPSPDAPRRAESGEFAIDVSNDPKIAIVGFPRRSDAAHALFASGYQPRILPPETAAFRVISYDGVIFHVENPNEGIDIAHALRIMRFGGCLVVVSRSIGARDMTPLQLAGVDALFRYPADCHEVRHTIERFLALQAPRPPISRTIEIERVRRVLTAGEFRVVRLLANANGQVVSWEEIGNERENADRNATQKAIERIRYKFRHLPIWLETKSGIGVSLTIMWL